jgi:hypothetical protein
MKEKETMKKRNKEKRINEPTNAHLYNKTLI